MSTLEIAQPNAGTTVARAPMQRESQVPIHVWRFVLLATSVGGWEIIARLKWIDPYLISSPLAIVTRLWTLLRSGEMVGHIYVTGIETLLGLVIGAVLGILLGMALALAPRLAVIFDPFLVAVNGLPRVALAPLFVVWFGIGLTSKVAVGASIVIFTMFFATYLGMRNTDPALLRGIKALGATSGQLLMKVQLPFAIPWIFAGLKTGVAMALVGAIIGEFIAASRGVGWYIAFAGGQFDTTGVFAGLFVLGVMAIVLDLAVALIGDRLMHWRPAVEA
jgi:NitT/TauT family transport system permease protein